MPLLDVSDIVIDPDLTDEITVLRSTRSVNTSGRTVDTPGTYYTYGSVQPAPQAALAQFPEAERVGSFVSVVTPMRLFALTATTGPDRLVWNNAIYQVRYLRDWSTWGRGFTEAICELISLVTDGPP